MLKGVVLETVLYKTIIIPKDSIVEVCGQEYSNLYPVHKYLKVIFEGEVCYIEKEYVKQLKV